MIGGLPTQSGGADRRRRRRVQAAVRRLRGQRRWSVIETIISVVGLTGVMILSLISMSRR
jgi:hypothetical protein